MISLKIKILLAATGLSSRQAGNLLGAPANSVKSWAIGRRKAPDSAVDALCDYYEQMMRWADAQSWPVPDVATDDEAMKLGFYSVASYRIAASKVFLENF